ncbi:MAG: DUF2339 domain-containing protein, partial [Dongiaceae bacterium]
MEGFALLGLLGIGLIVGVPIAAFVALARTGRLHREIEGLKMAITVLQNEIATPRREIGLQPISRASLSPKLAAETRVDSRQQESQATFRVSAESYTDQPASAIAEPPPTFGDAAEVPTAPEPPAEVAAAVAPARPPARTETLEEKLGVRLFIWVGGIALALAGAFLVKYSIDQGWLGPAVRCALGAALGLALLAGGEWMRSRDDRIAQSVSAAGVAVLYASLFAAIALYDLIESATGFLLLAGLTAGAIALALRQGPFVG